VIIAGADVTRSTGKPRLDDRSKFGDDPPGSGELPCTNP
jgi:hypothetical protein